MHRFLIALACTAVLAVLLWQTAARPAAGQDGTVREGVALFPGCNNVAVTWPNGTPAAAVAAAVMPPPAVATIWRFDPSTQSYRGFAPAFPAESDLPTVNRFDILWVCMHSGGVLLRPVLAPTGPIPPIVPTSIAGLPR